MRNTDGWRCPQFEHAARTGPGAIALRIVASPGVMRFAAMGGLSGLDWPSARLLCGAAEPWDEIAELLRFYESGAVSGAAALSEQMKLANKTGGADG